MTSPASRTTETAAWASQLGEATVAVSEHQSLILDEAIEESFPASDPIAVSFTRVECPSRPTAARKARATVAR